MRVVTLTEATATDSGPLLPVIDDAVMVVKEADSRWYTAYLEPVNELLLSLWKVSPGVYWASANKPKALKALPAGVAWAAYAAGGAMGTWRHWRIAGTVPFSDPDEPGVTEKATDDAVVTFVGDVPSTRPTPGNPWVLEGVTVTSAVPTLSSMCGHVVPSDVDRVDLRLLHALAAGMAAVTGAMPNSDFVIDRRAHDQNPRLGTQPRYHLHCGSHFFQ